jgi:hypothetical protein
LKSHDFVIGAEDVPAKETLGLTRSLNNYVSHPSRLRTKKAGGILDADVVPPGLGRSIGSEHRSKSQSAKTTLQHGVLNLLEARVRADGTTLV